MANESVDPPMEAPGVIMIAVASAAVLLLASLMFIEFVWGGSQAAIPRGGAHAAAPAAATATKPG